MCTNNWAQQLATLLYDSHALCMHLHQPGGWTAMLSLGLLSLLMLEKQ